jgi:hypothetical protein
MQHEQHEIGFFFFSSRPNNERRVFPPLCSCARVFPRLELCFRFSTFSCGAALTCQPACVSVNAFCSPSEHEFSVFFLKKKMFFCCFSLTIAYNISFFSLPITFLLLLKQKENSSCLNSDCEAENEEKVFLSLLWQAETYQFELMDKRVSSFDIFFFRFHDS